MSAEVLCIGTELLLGNITNGNARWLAEQLASLGIAHHRQEVVGDNRERLIAAVRAAAGRCRVLITTGGLGPTPDDLTTEAIAAAFDTPLVEHAAIWDDIQTKLSARGRPIAASNRKQALLPVGAQVLPNPTGTAPGMIWSPRPGFTVLTFPGVPSELHAMWQATAVPWLRQSRLAEGVFASRLLRFWGVGESNLAEQMDDLLAGTNPTVAPYAGAGEVKLRLTARAADQAAAEVLLAPVEAQIRSRTGNLCYGVDDDSLASVALAAVPGASDVFLGGVIAYANSVKQQLLGVPADTLAVHGAVSDPVALAMAAGARRVTGADWAIAVTGVAGPGGGSADKPVGLVHIAMAGPQGAVSEAVRLGASRGRGWIQTLTVGEALNRLRLAL